mgnify:FL=1
MLRNHVKYKTPEQQKSCKFAHYVGKFTDKWAYSIYSPFVKGKGINTSYLSTSDWKNDSAQVNLSLCGLFQSRCN